MILDKRKRRRFLTTTNSTGCILRKKCRLTHVIEGKIEGRIEVTVRRGRRRTQLQDDLK
jgi:hypothetical protein